MKFSATFYVVITTILLIAVVVMVHYNLPFALIFFTAVAGQAWWLITVYNILTDDYATEKTFDNWYEDKPLGK